MTDAMIIFFHSIKGQDAYSETWSVSIWISVFPSGKCNEISVFFGQVPDELRIWRRPDRVQSSSGRNYGVFLQTHRCCYKPLRKVISVLVFQLFEPRKHAKGLLSSLVLQYAGQLVVLLLCSVCTWGRFKYKMPGRMEFLLLTGVFRYN